MVQVITEGGELLVKLSPLGRFAALHGDLRLPVSAVTAAEVERFPWRALRGIRAPGTGFPGVIAYGSRRLTGERKDFVAVLGKRPALRIELDAPSEFARLVLSVQEPAHVAAQVRTAAGI